MFSLCLHGSANRTFLSLFIHLTLSSATLHCSSWQGFAFSISTYNNKLQCILYNYSLSFIFNNQWQREEMIKNSCFQICILMWLKRNYQTKRKKNLKSGFFSFCYKFILGTYEIDTLSIYIHILVCLYNFQDYNYLILILKFTFSQELINLIKKQKWIWFFIISWIINPLWSHVTKKTWPG